MVFSLGFQSRDGARTELLKPTRDVSALIKDQVLNYAEFNDSTMNEETLGRSSFPMQFFPINNTALPQEYFFFHKLQRHAHNPVLQLPFYEMTAQLPSSTSGSSSLSHVPDLDAGPSSYEWTIQQPSDSDLYQMNTRKRQKQTSDSDSSTENNRGNEFSQKFRNCKKNKRY
ncbi:splicing regulator RBM11-like [Callospermophilus lateralis]|uniref:splicing regulator RBM11-like n=1 Tax=Callospermophilus lateralis TaxID=76772 RepID=UPI0040389FCE